MVSLSLPTLVEEWRTRPRNTLATSKDALLVVSFGNPVAADFAQYVFDSGDRHVSLVSDPEISKHVSKGLVCRPLLDTSSHLRAGKTDTERFKSVVIFLNCKLSERDRIGLNNLVELARKSDVEFTCIVSSFRIHCGDRGAAETEAEVLARAKDFSGRTVIFRTGNVLCPNSRISKLLGRYGFIAPLVPKRFRSCFVEGEQLFAAIETERHDGNHGRLRTYALLGPNLAWKDVLAEHRAKGLASAILTVFSALLSVFFVGHLAGLVLTLLARRSASLRHLNFDTLRPESMIDLLAIYNRYNYAHVKVVGYNNGVVHFGHRYPGRTVISTVRCNRTTRVGTGLLKVDCGTTVRKALDFLAVSSHELPVVPNYSYVCLGTAFFVPIHGSAADFSTVADTITRVVLYDPVHDRFLSAARDEPVFREAVYNLNSDRLLLRLYLKVKPKSRYFIQRTTRQVPDGADILDHLCDAQATNVEIRKASAAGDTVTVCKFYKDPAEANSPVLELPRDKLGRLWDRLEENPITSFLMHALTRHFAWHVELFLTTDEFVTFWKTHHQVPVRKIQVRHIRRDGLPHSPFRDHDCVSVDLFMLRRHRRTFEAYLKKTFTVVRTNPGKHSR